MKKCPLPQWTLIKSIRLRSNSFLKAVDLYCCPDVVSRFDATTEVSNQEKECVVALINPCNQSLSGTGFPYFPIGGPLPVHVDEKLTSSASWGGMEAGPNMLYPSQAVDGRVTTDGGLDLRRQLDAILASTGTISPGDAVWTLATDRLQSDHQLDYIIHTPPPFQSEVDGMDVLTKCYTTSIMLCFQEDLNIDVLSSPLLGSGACGFSREVAFQAFVAAVQNIEVLGEQAKLSPSKQQQIASFRLVIPSIDDAILYSKKLDAIWPSTSEHPCTQQI